MYDLSDVPHKELLAEMKRRNQRAWSLLEVPTYVLLTIAFFAGFFVRMFTVG